MHEAYNTPTKNYFWLRILICVTVVYIGISYGFFAFSAQNYRYRQNNWLQQQATIILNPLSEIFTAGKVSHYWNWTNTEQSSIPSNIQALRLTSKNTQYREYGKMSYKNILASLGAVSEAAIVSPVNYNGEWSIVYCAPKDNICQTGDIMVKGYQKILVDGQINIWGLSKDNEYIQLKLISYINRNDSRDIVFV